MSAQFPDLETTRSALMLAARHRRCTTHNPGSGAWGAQPALVRQSATALAAHRPRRPRHDGQLRGHAESRPDRLRGARLASQDPPIPNPDDPDHLASLELHRHPAGDLDIALAAAIPRRRTDRRRYSPWLVAHGDIALMGSRAARMGVTMRRVDDLPGLQGIVAEAAWRHAGDRDYSAELATWSGRYGAAAGVPARNTPKPDARAPIPARWFAGPVLTQPQGSDAHDDGAVVIALGTTDDGELSRLRAGEATSTVLLTATALGLASCPITEPLEFTETRAGVREHVFDGDSCPQMLLRIG